MKNPLTLKKQTIANLTRTVNDGQRVLITPIVVMTHDLTWW